MYKTDLQGDIVLLILIFFNMIIDNFVGKNYFICMGLTENHQDGLKDPQAYAIHLISVKNWWLIRIRWFYTALILVFFFLYRNFADVDFLNFRNFLLIMALAVIGNLIFIFSLRRLAKLEGKKDDYQTFFYMATLQLDFDLIVISLFTFFSGGFESPVIVLFIFYIMISTFLIFYKKALRNTIIAIGVIMVMFFSNEGALLSSQQLTTMLAFNVILLFAFFISLFLSRNLRENEKVLQELLKKTSTLSITDGLTKLYNQSHFFRLLDMEVEQSQRYNLSFSLIIFDVDFFKNYNDNMGHIRGSAALCRIGEIMRGVFRASDILAKYGGDEFVVILPTTDRVGAFLAADRLRETVEGEPFEGSEKQPTGSVTLSLGLASFPEHGSSGEEILEHADKALYLAKEKGRNRVVIYGEDKAAEDGQGLI